MALSLYRSGIVAGTFAILTALAVGGCEVSRQESNGAASTAPASTTFVRKEKGGAELWAQTCSHCHNLRSPSTYGPAQWEIAMYDMRVRAHLTGEEQRKILAFLKSAS